jgi:hypothetical protein
VKLVPFDLSASDGYRLIIDHLVIDKSIYIISRQRLSRELFRISGGSGGGGGTGQKILIMTTQIKPR